MNKPALRSALKFLDSWLNYRARQLDIPGFVVAILYKDALVFSRTYGFADSERKKVLATKHLFAMGSQAKMLAATAALQLVERGKLRLDDRACDYLPWLSGHHDRRFLEITIRQLLGHTAGLTRDGRRADFWTLKQPFPDTTALRAAILAANDIVLEPNTQPKYSNLGFALLGQIIEAAGGQSYVDYVHKHIIKPLKLSDTFADYTPAISHRLAAGYGVAFDRQRPVLEPRLPTQAMASVVGLHATAEDMCHFASAHFFGDNTLLSDRLKKEMQRSQWVLSHGYDSGLEAGLGLEIQYIGERRVVGHSGHLAGHLTATFWDPYERLAVTVAANCKDAPSVQIVRGIFGALDWFSLSPASAPPADLARFSARLCCATSIIEVVASSHRLAAIDPDDWEPFTWLEELERVDATTLRVTTPGSTLNQGELLRYTFARNKPKAANFGGVTMLPEAAYRRQLK